MKIRDRSRNRLDKSLLVDGEIRLIDPLCDAVYQNLRCFRTRDVPHRGYVAQSDVCCALAETYEFFERLFSAGIQRRNQQRPTAILCEALEVVAGAMLVRIAFGHEPP